MPLLTKCCYFILMSQIIYDSGMKYYIFTPLHLNLGGKANKYRYFDSTFNKKFYPSIFKQAAHLCQEYYML